MNLSLYWTYFLILSRGHYKWRASTSTRAQVGLRPKPFQRQPRQGLGTRPFPPCRCSQERRLRLAEQTRQRRQRRQQRRQSSLTNLWQALFWGLIPFPFFLLKNNANRPLNLLVSPWTIFSHGLKVITFLVLDAPFVSAIVLFKNQQFPQVFCGFLERKIPEKNGEATPRVVLFAGVLTCPHTNLRPVPCRN